MLHKRHSNVTKDASDGLHASCRSKVIYVTKDAGSEDRPPGLGKGIERERERERERELRDGEPESKKELRDGEPQSFVVSLR